MFSKCTTAQTENKNLCCCLPVNVLNIDAVYIHAALNNHVAWVLSASYVVIVVYVDRSNISVPV